jgi:hypothetical protein
MRQKIDTQIRVWAFSFAYPKCEFISHALVILSVYAVRIRAAIFFLWKMTADIFLTISNTSGGSTG